jgi:ribonuclease P protein component
MMTRLPRKNPPPPLQSTDAGRTTPVHSTIQTCIPIKAGIQSLTGKRLQRHADYQRAYAASRKRQSPSMSWFLARQASAYTGAALPAGPRVGLTAGKVLGKAHERNRIKRRMREALRRHADMLPTGFDLILHPRRFVLTLEFAKLEAEIVRILHQAQAEAVRMSQEAPAI